MMDFGQPVAKPEWLDDGLRNAIQTFQLALDGRIPDKIKARMLTTACLRVLRAINGSDLETAATIRKLVLDKQPPARSAAGEPVQLDPERFRPGWFLEDEDR